MVSVHFSHLFGQKHSYVRFLSFRRSDARGYLVSARAPFCPSTSTSGSCDVSLVSCHARKPELSVLEHLDVRARRRTACALLVIQNMQSVLPLVLTKYDLEVLFNSVYSLQRESFVSSLTINALQAEVYQSTHCLDIRAGQVAALLLTTVAMLARRHSCEILAYAAAAASSHVAYLQPRTTIRRETSILNWLLSVGLSQGQMPSFRRLALHMTAELLPHMLPNSTEVHESHEATFAGVNNAIRYQTTLLLVQFIEKTLPMSVDSQNDVFFALLPLFAALAHSEAGPSCYDKATPAVMSLPDLIASLSEASPVLASAVFRGLGSVALWQTYSLDTSTLSSLLRHTEVSQSDENSIPVILQSSYRALSATYLLHEKVLRALANRSCWEARARAEDAAIVNGSSLAVMCTRLLSHRSDKVRNQLNAMRTNSHTKTADMRLF